MEEDLISIVVPVYNVEKYIDKCIQSIINQTYKNLEIILVDDGSKDNSGKICSKYEKLDSRIRVIHKSNGGVSKARNLGINLAKGKYIAFVDSDDYIDENMYEVLYKDIKEKNTNLACCNYYYHERENKKKLSNKSKEIIDNNIEYVDDNKKYLYLMNNKSMRGYIFNKLFDLNIIKINGLKFDDNIYFCEDILFVSKYLEKISGMTIRKTKLYHYIKRKTSALGGKKNIDKYVSIITAYKSVKDIFEKNASEYLDYILLEYVQSAIKTKGVNRKKNKEIDEECNKIISKYYKRVMCSKNIRILMKMKILIRKIIMHIKCL